jgi:hypothetical protein
VYYARVISSTLRGVESREIDAARAHIRAAVALICGIEDDRDHMRSAHEAATEMFSAASELIGERMAAANRLRDEDLDAWPYRKIAVACGIESEYLAQVGQAIVKGSPSRRRRAAVERPAGTDDA